MSTAGDAIDWVQELSDLIEEAGLVWYFIPPPGRATICVCTWPDGYPGTPRLDPRCPAHAWVRPAQAKKNAEHALPFHRWGDDGGRSAEES
jgi:hypothetical protein